MCFDLVLIMIMVMIMIQGKAEKPVATAVQFHSYVNTINTTNKT